MAARLLISLWALVLLSGCARVVLTGTDPGYGGSFLQRDALVGGRVVVAEDGRVKTPYGRFYRPKLTFFSVEGDRLIRKEWPGVDSDGRFYWRASRGTFVLTDITLSERGILSTVVQPQVVMRVPPGSDVVYAGTLVVNVVEGKAAGVTVVDDSGGFLKRFSADVPDFTGTVEKSLMVHDPSIPTDPALVTKRAIQELLDGVGTRMMRP